MGQFVGGSGAGGAGGANPAGSGTELNARLNGTTFQAVTGSSISGANVTLTGTVTAAGFIGSGSGNSIALPEAPLSGNAGGFDVISADSATHTLYESDNNGTFIALAKTFVNSQTGTLYNTLPGDCNKLISQSNAAASAVTLTPEVSGCKHFIQNRGAGTLTVTPALAPPGAPGLSTSTSGGSLAAATSDCVVLTFVNASGETTKGLETCVTTGAGTTNSITVTAPTLPTGAGAATGYTVYSGPTGSELKQLASNACVNITTNCVIQVLGAGVAPPTTNTAAAGTLDGATSLALTQNQGVMLATDGSNWFSGNRGMGGLAGTTVAVNGLSLSSPNFANNFQTVGSNIFYTNVPQFVNGYGDSITAASTGVTGANQGFIDLIQARTGGGVTNYGHGGDQAPDMVKSQIIANTQNMTVPPAPGLATSTSGGSLGAGASVFVKITYNTVLGETTASAEATVTTGAGGTNSVTVTAPVPPAGQAGYVTGYTVYSSTTTGNELQQTASNACVNVAIGTNCVIQVIGAGAAVPASNTAYIPFTTEDNLTTILIGTNDVTQYGATASLQTLFQQTLGAGIVWSTSSTPVFGQGTSCTPTGTWSADNTALAGLGRKSNTNGDTLSCANIQVNNGVLYVVYRIINGDGGTFTVKVDGVTQTDTISGSSTINAFPGASMTTLNGGTDTFGLARFTGLTNGTHTVLFTVTSATNVANIVSISALATPPSLAYATPERVYVGGVIKQQADANSVLTAAYNTLVQNMVTTLSGDGLLVYFVDVRAYLNTTSDMFNGLHPNNTGHAHLRDAFAAQIQYPMNNAFYQIGMSALTPQNLAPDSFIYRSNPQTFSFGNSTRNDTTGILRATDYQVFNGANKTQELNTAGLVVASNGLVSWSNSTTSLGTVDVRLTRSGTGVAQIGTASAGATGYWKSASLIQQAASNYTNATTTPSNFASWSLPAQAINWSFVCELVYQASASTATLALSINSSAAPTSQMATGQIYINTTGAASTFTTATIVSTASGNVAVLTGGTPAATGTNYVARIYGTTEQTGSAGTFAIQAAAGGVGTLTILRGSYCRLY